MDKKAAMQRIIELTYSEDWQNDKEAASEVMRLGRERCGQTRATSQDREKSQSGMATKF